MLNQQKNILGVSDLFGAEVFHKKKVLDIRVSKKKLLEFDFIKYI